MDQGSKITQTPPIVIMDEVVLNKVVNKSAEVVTDHELTEVKKTIIINLEDTFHEDHDSASDSSSDSMTKLFGDFSTISNTDSEYSETGHERGVFYNLGKWLNIVRS